MMWIKDLSCHYEILFLFLQDCWITKDDSFTLNQVLDKQKVVPKGQCHRTVSYRILFFPFFLGDS
jgi:hypothetical protein